MPCLVFGQLLSHGIEQPAHGNVVRRPASSGMDDRLGVSSPGTGKMWHGLCQVDLCRYLNTLGGDLAYRTGTVKSFSPMQMRNAELW